MSLIASQPESMSFELAPQGNHMAICYMVCDLGFHDSSYQGGPTTSKRKVRISFEIPGEPMEDGRPFSVSSEYTLSLSEKANLRKDLESWRGRAFTEEELSGFDVFNVLGKPCMVNVVHKTSKASGNEYPVIASVAALPKGFDVPEPSNTLVFFSLDDFNQELYAGFPDWLKGKINVANVKLKTRTPPINFPTSCT